MNSEISEKKYQGWYSKLSNILRKVGTYIKILNVLINLSLLEDLFSNEKNRNDCLKKCDDLFKKLDNEK